MDYRDRAQEIAGIVAAVADAGVVHTRERWAREWSAFLALFKDADGKIRGWEISRGPATPESAPDWIETWRLQHYLGLSDADATELDFQEHLDAVVRAFRDPITSVLTWGAVPLGLKILVAEQRAFGGVLCHYALCELAVVMPYDQL